MPASIAVRENRTMVEPKSGSFKADFAYGLERFLQEAKILARFRHPNIVRVQRYFQGNGTGYFVMDYEKGRTLDIYLREKGDKSVSLSELKSIFLPLLEGLIEVHERSSSFGEAECGVLLHRDIKPGNIFLRQDSDLTGSPE